MLNALIGGILVGLAAALLFAMNGRIAGISGIASGLARGPAGERGWRAAFLLGLFFAALVFEWLQPGTLAPHLRTSKLFLVISGLLVGFGTVFGNGCTSGHGVCGISRFSRRSLVATLVFMASGIATVTLVRLVGVPL